MSEEEDLTALVATPGVKLAAGAVGATGFVALLICLQTYSALRVEGVVRVVVPVSFLLGAALVFFAIHLRRLRGWGAKGAVLVTALSNLLSLAWFVFAVLNGFVSALGFLLIPLSATSSLLSFPVVLKARRADEVRARLEASGLDAGF